MSVLELLPSSSTYLRSAKARFPLSSLQVGREDVFSFPGSKNLLDYLREEGSGAAEGFCKALAPAPQGQGFRGWAAGAAGCLGESGGCDEGWECTGAAPAGWNLQHNSSTLS